MREPGSRTGVEVTTSEKTPAPKRRSQSRDLLPPKRSDATHIRYYSVLIRHYAKARPPIRTTSGASVTRPVTFVTSSKYEVNPATCAPCSSHDVHPCGGSQKQPRNKPQTAPCTEDGLRVETLPSSEEPLLSASPGHEELQNTQDPTGRLVRVQVAPLGMMDSLCRVWCML